MRAVGLAVMFENVNFTKAKSLAEFYMGTFLVTILAFLAMRILFHHSENIKLHRVCALCL